MKQNYGWAYIVIILIVGVICYIGYNKWNNRALSFVSININPEIELALNNQDEVVDVISINEDADIVTSDLDLIGLTIEEASDKIIDATMETGYLDEYSEENIVVVTTINDDDEKRVKLEEKIITRMNAHFETRKIYPILVAKGLDNDLKAEATKYGISNGKMLLIERAVSLNEELSKDELAKLSVRDIQKEIHIYVKERRAALKESLEDAREEWQQKKEELKQEYAERINQLKDSITEEQREFFNKLDDAQKEEAIRNYLNTKKEAIKNKVNEVKEEIKEEVKENMQNYNYPILKNNVEKIKQNIKNLIEQRRNNKNN